MSRASLPLFLAMVALPGCFTPGSFPGTETDDMDTSSSSADVSPSSGSSVDTSATSTSGAGSTSMTTTATTATTSGSSAGPGEGSSDETSGSDGEESTAAADPCEGLICGAVQGVECGACVQGQCVGNVLCCTPPTASSVIAGPVEARSLHLAGNRLYVADFGEGLREFDISNIASPTETGLVVQSSYIWDIDVAAGRAYVAWAYAGLVVVDISTPGQPYVIGSETDVLGTGVAVEGNYAYMAAGAGDALHVIDVSNGAAPTHVGTAAIAGQALRVAVANDHAFLPVDTGELAIIDVADPADPLQTSSFTTQGSAADVVINGNYAYVGEGYYGFEVVDIADPEDPTLVGSAPITDDAGLIAGIDVSGNRLALAAGGRTIFFDVSDPSAPIQIGEVAAPGGGVSQRVRISGDRAFVAAGTGGVQTIEVPECE